MQARASAPHPHAMAWPAVWSRTLVAVRIPARIHATPPLRCARVTPACVSPRPTPNCVPRSVLNVVSLHATIAAAQNALWIVRQQVDVSGALLMRSVMPAISVSVLPPRVWGWRAAWCPMPVAPPQHVPIPVIRRPNNAWGTLVFVKQRPIPNCVLGLHVEPSRSMTVAVCHVLSPVADARTMRFVQMPIHVVPWRMLTPSVWQKGIVVLASM